MNTDTPLLQEISNKEKSINSEKQSMLAEELPVPVDHL